MFAIGCDGGTNAISGVVPSITRKLYDSVMAGQIEEARRLQYLVCRLFDVLLYSADFPEAFRTAVGIRGFNMGLGRQPLSEEHKSKLIGLKTQVRNILDDMGISREASAAGRFSTTADSDRVGQIVQGVVAALQQQGVI
jgi:4-hydroxy-tetrahydrodipicolinate synthase